MSADKQTLDYYDAHAAEYASLGVAPKLAAMMERFIEALPPGGAALDYGCGPAWAAKAFVDRGFQVSAFDGSAGMVAEAEHGVGLKVDHIRFEEFRAEAAFDGVWASFSLLHASRADIPALLEAVHRALRPRGVLFVSVKSGAESLERRDALGRFYSDFSRLDLEAVLAGAGFDMTRIELDEGAGMDGVVFPLLYALARRAET